MSKSLVTINPLNQPVSSSVPAEIQLIILQVANPYVSVFLTHIIMPNYLHCSVPLLNSSWTFPMLTLSDHQFACQFLLIGFHPTRITAASLYERMKWFFFLQQCQGPYQGIKLSLHLLLIILSFDTVSFSS